MTHNTHADFSLQYTVEVVQLADAENRGQKQRAPVLFRHMLLLLQRQASSRSNCSKKSSFRMSSPGAGVATRSMRMSVQADQGKGLID